MNRRLTICFAAVLLLYAFAVRSHAETVRVVNDSNGPIYVAIAFFRPQSNYIEAGDYHLPMVTFAAWISAGWWKVKPGQRTEIYSGKARHAYIYIDESESPVGPNAIRTPMPGDTRNFCLFNGKKFSAAQYEDNTDRFYEVSLNDRNSCAKPQGCTCRELGGEWVRFYQVDRSSAVIFQ